MFTTTLSRVALLAVKHRAADWPLRAASEVTQICERTDNNVVTSSVDQFPLWRYQQILELGFGKWGGRGVCSVSIK